MWSELIIVQVRPEEAAIVGGDLNLDAVHDVTYDPTSKYSLISILLCVPFSPCIAISVS